jgi:hypothetical protein
MTLDRAIGHGSAPKTTFLAAIGQPVLANTRKFDDKLND